MLDTSVCSVCKYLWSTQYLSGSTEGIRKRKVTTALKELIIIKKNIEREVFKAMIKICYGNYEKNRLAFGKVFVFWRS